MLGIEGESLLRQLRLDVPARRAVFTVNRRLYYHSGCILVGGLRDLQVNVTIGIVDARVLQKCVGYMKELKFASGSRSVGGNECILRPAQNRIDGNFLGSAIRQGNMLRRVPKIGDIGLHGHAGANVL